MQSTDYCHNLNTPAAALFPDLSGFFGVPETHYPDAEQILLFIGATIFTLFSYWYGYATDISCSALLPCPPGSEFIVIVAAIYPALS